MGNNDHSLGRRDRNFIILTEASGMVEPGESTFHPPSPRQFFPLVWLDLLWNINIKASFFSSVNPTLFAGCYRFYTLGINDRVTRILLTSGICSRLLQDVPEFYPTTHWFWLGGKSCVLLNMAENHGVIVSICHPESTKYSTASVNSRLLHVQFRIPVYSGAISSHCLSVKSLGYDFRPFSSIIPSYHRSLPLWIQLLKSLVRSLYTVYVFYPIDTGVLIIVKGGVYYGILLRK